MNTPKVLLPHQVECVDLLVAEALREGRAQAQLACASGKTLIGLRTAERLMPQDGVVLVLAPTLILLEQLAKEWRENKQDLDWDFAGVGGRLEDYPASTKPKEIAKLLKSVPRLVLFCTYISSPVVAEALELADRKISVAIFDEAHRTTQKEDAAFATGLAEVLLPISYRIFLTATPRYILDDPDDEVSYYSMNDEGVYGRRVYSLSLNRAISSGLVCDYRVLVPILRGKPSPQGQSFSRKRAREISRNLYEWPDAQIAALEKTIEDWKVKKVITFHATIAESKAFAHAWNNEIKFDGEIHALAIHSEMKAKQRQEALQLFSDAKRCILSNPHLLSEGIDVPSTDLVALLCNTKSPIRTAQVMGRVLRKDPSNPRKRTGYLMVPIFISEDIDVADVQDEATLGPLWDVLECLLEQTEGFEKIERRQEIEKAIEGVFKQVELFDPWQNVTRTMIDRIKERLVIRWIERLTTKWDDHFENMLVFKQAYGHCHIAREDGKTQRRINHWHPLVQWALRQRKAYEAGTLRVDRLNRLSQAGFVFRPSTSTWDEAYLAEWQHLSQKLGTKALPNRYGTQPAPWEARLSQEDIGYIRSPYPEDCALDCERFSNLCVWACRARRAVDPDTRAMLDSLGFIRDHKEAYRLFREAVAKTDLGWLQELNAREERIKPK